MDMLKRNLAPITDAAWAEIEAEARRQLTPRLSARRFADVDGPFGWEFAAVSTGRLKTSKQKNVITGIHQVLPLIELRVPFTVSQDEMDAIGRGVKDIDFGTLRDAAIAYADYEEKSVFFGNKAAGITGIYEVIEGAPVPLKLEAANVLEAVTEAKLRLILAGVEGEANLVVSDRVWKYLARRTCGTSLENMLEKEIGGKVIRSEQCKGALLVSARGGDIELTIGQDISIGYAGTGEKGIELCFAGSFTSRVLSPEAFVALEIK
ncbi:MAG: family 1 encapsulin nanocompartment shell protein [Kiritimatiellales bacterium]